MLQLNFLFNNIYFIKFPWYLDTEQWTHWLKVYSRAFLKADILRTLCTCLVAQSCLTLPNPVDGSPPDSSVHRVLQLRTLEWVAIPFSRGTSQPSGQTPVSSIIGSFFTIWATGEAPKTLQTHHKLVLQRAVNSFRLADKMRMSVTCTSSPLSIYFPKIYLF